MSRAYRDYLRSGYLHHRLPACTANQLNAITLIPQSPARQKCQRTGSWRTRQLLTCRCVSVMPAALDAKYTKELADVEKVENDACVMMLPLVVVGCTSCCSLSSREATIASGVDNAVLRLADIMNGIISPSVRRGDHIAAKQLEGTQKYINEQCRQSCSYITGNSCNYCEHTRFQRSSNA